MDFDQTQAIYDYEEEEEEQVKQDKTNAKKKEAAQLKVFSQQGFKETCFPIFQGDNVIGRDGKCNITIPIKALSKKHACIEVQRDLHLIYDCQSKNRTKKGKSFLKPTIRYELKHGDMLTFGDVKCQYVVDMDTEEDEGDETGSETASESMLPEATTEEESINGDKPVVHEDFPNIADATSGPPDEELMQSKPDSKKVPKPAIEDEEEAYAADTDSDTDDEQPLAAAAVLTVMYSSEDEHETSTIRQNITSVPHKQNCTTEGQTLAFGLGSPDNVFQNRDSSSSNIGDTGNIPHPLMFSSESDVQSDGKGELSSDNRRNSPKHPEARNTGNQPSCEPTLLCGSDDYSPVKRPGHFEVKVLDKQDQASCQPTLLYASESDDASPLKKPRHPEAMASKNPEPSSQPTLLYGFESDDESPLKRPSHPQAGVSKKPDPSCQPTLLYGSESDDGSPIKKPTYRGIINVPMVLGESDSEDGTDKTNGSNKHSHQTVSSSHGKDTEEKRHDRQGPAVTGEAEATLLYAAAEMSSTDDEEEPEGNPDVEKPTQAYTNEESGRKELNNEEDNMATDEYGDDCATQPYAMDSNFETESETIPCVEADKSDANRSAKPFELEATQAYCVEDGKDDQEEDSNSSDSQPLPLGPTAEGAHGGMVGPVYDGLGATQAYNISVKDGNTDDEQVQDAEPTLAYDLQATQAYGVCVSDDTDDEDNSKSESHVERMEGQSCEPKPEVTRSDAVQATIPYGLEATQAYGADETDDEDSDDQGRAGSGGDQTKGSGNTVTSGLAATLPYGGGDDDDNEDNDDDDYSNKRTNEHVRQKNQATLACGLDETQAYDAESNDTDSASHSAIEATQAYGIEEHSEGEVQTKKGAIEKMSAKRVAFAGSSTDEKEGEDSVTETDENKPSTGSVANVEEEFQDSEDVIQPRSRSRRRRKTPVIEESQEYESQQTSGRLSSSKRKSKAPNKLSNDENERETAVNRSTSGATQQLQAACEGLQDETSLTTAGSRKGRREAMRVTIEADELDEEEDDVPQEPSLRRASKGKKEVEETDEQEERNEQATSTTRTAGRKRGRQAAKRNAQESGVEVKETPAPKSRRGRKGKSEQFDAVSVSETPLNTVHGTNNADAADCQTSTPTDVEPTSVRRRGRGRGRKGAATPQTVQKAQDQETCIESQPETLVESTPSSTKGKGKGRGKRIQPLIIEQEPIDSTAPKASVNSSEVKSQVYVAPPTSGKGRGRGKKKQSWTTELEVPETTVIEEDLQPPDESPAVTEASKGRARGRLGRGGKRTTQPSRTATLESSEDVSLTPLTPESGEGSQMRKRQSRTKASSSVQGPSSDVEVEETPAKKIRHGKEPAVAYSPSVKQGKPAGESNPRVIFTGLVDKQGEKVVTSLGGELVNNIHGCTHLVTDKVRRTVKFLCGLASGQMIVLPSWLDACKRTKSFVDTTPFLVKDKEAEKQYKFDLARSHEVALRKGLLEGYKVHVTKKVLPEPSQMKDIIQSAKGEFLSSMPRGKEDKIFVISCKEDRSVCKKPLQAGIPVVSAEVLLTGILRQELNLEEHKLFENEMSDTSQDLSTNSSGQNKRSQEQSETDTPAPTAAKRSSSKRRKK